MLDKRTKFINAYSATKKLEEKPKVLALTYYDAYWAGGLGSTEGSIISLSGGINIAAEAGVKSNDMITKESLISMNPDVIIIPQSKEWGGEAFLDDLVSDATLSEIKAIKDNKVYLVDPRYFTTLSHWNLRGSEELMKILWDDLASKNFLDFNR
jgi:iron complex transport system substrate-binding protein